MSDKLQPQSGERVFCEGKMLEIVHWDVQIGSKIKVFEKARRAPGTRLIITDGGNNILMTREFRLELNNGKGGYDFRLPGGKVFDSLKSYREALDTGQDIITMAQEAALKEAKEEAGIIDVQSIELISVEHCGASVQWDLFYYLVKTDLGSLAGQELEDGEDIEVKILSEREVFDKCIEGEIKEARTVGVLMKYLAKKLNL